MVCLDAVAEVNIRFYVGPDVFGDAGGVVGVDIGMSE